MDPEATQAQLPLSTEHGRQRRFSIGDRVTLCRGKWYESNHVVLGWACDPHPAGMEHCCGNSARYTLEGVDGPVWDWQLERAQPTVQERLENFFTWLLTSLRQ